MSITKTTMRSLRPVGALEYAAMGSLGSEWLRLDGSLYTRAQYPLLFALIGTTYNTGGEALTSFRVPNVSDRVVVGFDNYGTGAGAASRNTNSGHSTLFGQGGAATLGLTLSQIPNHTHTTGEAVHTHAISVPSHVHSAAGHGRGGTAIGLLGSGGGTLRAYNNSGAEDTTIGVSSAFTSFPTSGAGYSIGASGAGSAHDNEQPTVGLYFFVKAL